jgi:hypothetical protein
MRSLFLFVLLFSHQSYCSEISSKALKLGSNANNYQTTTKDPFFDFGPDEEDQGTSTTTTEDPFFSFDDPFDSGSDSLGLPHCDTILDEVEQNPGINCDNSTVFEPEIRYNDQVFERLFAQVWSDFQYKLNNEAQLYGVVLDPFDVDAKLPQPIDIKQQGSGYNVGVKMHGIKVIYNKRLAAQNAFNVFKHIITFLSSREIPKGPTYLKWESFLFHREFL